MFLNCIKKVSIAEKKGELTVCIVGLGYVGFPLLEEFSKYFRAIGFDVNEKKSKN